MAISIMCSLVVVVFVSIHACNARLIGLMKKDSEESFHHLLGKDKQKSSSLNIRVLDPSSKEFNKAAINKDSAQEISKAHDDEHYHRKNLGEIHQGHRNGVKSSSSQSSISWNVPHKKKGEYEQQPEFNLDYAPPKTHPPVHN